MIPPNKIFIIKILLLIICYGTNVVWAEQKRKSNINWLVDDANLLILQNKTYKKNKNFCFDLATGKQEMSNFIDTTQIQMKGSFYFLDDWGFEGFYAMINNTDNSSLKSLQQITTQTPFIRKISSNMGFSLLYSPFYAKINIWNQIIYFYLNTGIGLSLLTATTNFDQYLDTTADTDNNQLFTKENLTGYNLKIEFKFYLTKNILLSPSIVNTFYSSKEAKENTPSVVKNFQDYLLAIGFSI